MPLNDRAETDGPRRRLPKPPVVRRLVSPTSRASATRSSCTRNSGDRGGAEDRLRRQEAELADLFENASVGLLLVSPEGVVVRANPSFLATIGAKARRVINRALADWMPDLAEEKELLERLARRETLHNHPAELRTRRGTPRYVLIDADGQWEEGRLIHSRWFVRDISRRRQLERDILEISDRERRSFAQELHDGMGQQLGGIAYLAGVLRDSLAEKRLAEVSAAERIAKLARQSLKDARRMARGLAPLRDAPEGLVEALHDLALQTKTVQGARCHLRCSSAILVQDTVTAGHLFRIAQEAVTNAIKHGRARHIQIRLRISKGRLHLVVADDGAGIRMPAPNRTGLGLRIMQYRADLIRGRFAIMKRRRGGTQVSCSIPWIAASQER